MVNKQFDTIVNRPLLDSFGVIEPNGFYSVPLYTRPGIGYSGSRGWSGNRWWRYESSSDVISKGLTKW